MIVAVIMSIFLVIVAFMFVIMLLLIVRRVFLFFDNKSVSIQFVIMVVMIIITASRLNSRVHLLNLNSRVEYLILFSQDGSSLLHSFVWFQCSDMCTHGHFALRNSPHVEIVDFFNFIKIQNVFKAL